MVIPRQVVRSVRMTMTVRLSMAMTIGDGDENDPFFVTCVSSSS